MYLDLEVGRDGRFHGAAALRDGETRRWEKRPAAEVDRELGAWLRPGDVLVGHNLHRFDLPQWARLVPGSALLGLPSLDTLELSVLAFPQRPYHALVKDDRLVRDALPNPAWDVALCERVFEDAASALLAVPEAEAALLRALLVRVPHPPSQAAGWRALFDRLGWAWEAGPLDLATAWRGRACVSAPEVRKPQVDLAFVMIAAWMRAANAYDGSVLPRWVRATWPGVPTRIRALRATFCDDPRCAWCTQNASPEHWLERVTGFPAFRPTPAAPGGGSLQRLLVARGLSGEDTFGILPTGGGKSLCFQVPAEARFRMLGQLTVVISPLQSLMKDQVDGLRERMRHAEAVYSGLPTLLRPQVLDNVASGACGLLYLSPEQFRNEGMLRLLDQREIGAIVFDEAHCLSQWGHDFRTDYPYVLNALKRRFDERELPMPPVFLFTATTQVDATEQILEHVTEHTGRRPALFDGGSKRTNLTYVVERVQASDRLNRAAELIAAHIGAGAAIVFCGSRKSTESTAEALRAAGFDAVAYHAGLKADVRKQVQEAFLGGHHAIITATNAFGMGVDKPDVRVVVHLDMPSSLEAYLQEAGRAGRDGAPALAYLLWAPGDAEPRFALGASGDLNVEDLQALWRAIKRLPYPKDRRRFSRDPQRETRIVTARELLFQEALAGRFDPRDEREETRVKAGVNWLERARVLERRENITAVFSGKPNVQTLQEGVGKIEKLGLAPEAAKQWKSILEAVFQGGDDGLSADEIGVLANVLNDKDPIEGGLRVLRILTQLAQVGLVTEGQTFTAFVDVGVADSSAARLQRWLTWENRLLDQWGARDDEDGLVHLPTLAQALGSPEAPCTPPEVARLLGTWAHVALGQSNGRSLVRFEARRGQPSRLTVEVEEKQLRAWVQTRQAIAKLALAHLASTVEGKGKGLLASTTLEALVAQVEGDLILRQRGLVDVSGAVRAAVGWLHELGVVVVQNGLAVFRSAMRLDRDPSWGQLRGGGGAKVASEAAEVEERSEAEADAEHATETGAARAALEALREHAESKILRVHVIDAWARRMLEDPAGAEQMRADWFSLSLEAFVKRWFPGKKATLRIPTGEESYAAIVTALGDAEQVACVTRSPSRNHLVLAGPGSGKTRVLVHRVAWLLRVQRVRAKQILVVCYTRANAVELKRRLTQLVGADARFVKVQTLHGVALGLVGAEALPKGDDPFGQLLLRAAEVLQGGADVEDAVRRRDALLHGVQHLLIDEYQDLDAKQYALLRALTGCAMGGDQRKLKVFAVGDDDQAIYAFQGGSLDFIRAFEEHYGAHRIVLHHNYRNPAALLDMAQVLVRPLEGRLKADEALTVDPKRRADPPMGAFAEDHPELRGRVLAWRGGDVRESAYSAMLAVRRWLDAGVPAQEIAVLAQNRPTGLHPLRVAAEKLEIPFSWTFPSGAGLPVGRVREVVGVHAFLDSLPADRIGSERIAAHLDALGTGPWAEALRGWLAPSHGRTQTRDAWRFDLLQWAQLERRARTVGQGVHLGTLHSAKGLEFEHVVLFDDGRLDDRPEHRRLMYVALTRARRSLQIFSPSTPSPVVAALAHPCLAVTPLPPVEAPPPHAYDLLGPSDIWIDWLGQQAPSHPGHRVLAEARVGDRFRLEARGEWLAMVDEGGVEVARLSKAGRERWGPRAGCGLALRLVAVCEERAAREGREEAYRGRLRVERWWTGVWEGRFWVG